MKMLTFTFGIWGERILNKRSIAAFGAGLSLIALLSACSSGGTENDGPGSVAEPPKKAENKEPIEITITTNAGHTLEAFNMRFGDSIQKKFPQYKIKYIGADIKFDQLIPTNTPVDIVYAAIIDFGRGPLAHGMVYDMTELMKKHGVDLNRINFNWLDGFKDMWGGKIYGLPISIEAMTLFYNKDIFDRFGVPYPKNGMTWDDALELNKRLTRVEQGTQYLGLVFGASQHFSLNGLSLPYYDMKSDKPSLSLYEAKWKTVYETLAVRPLEAPGYKEAVVEAKGALPAESKFYKDRIAAMSASLAHGPLSWKEMQEVNWDMVSYPTYKETPNTGSQANLLLWGITNMSKHKDEAMEVIKFLYSDEFQTITSRDGNIPAVITEERKNEFAKNTYYKDRNVKAVFYNNFAPLSPRTIYDPDIASLFRAHLNDLTLGNMDLNTMMRTVEEEVTKKVAEIKSR